MPSLAPRSRKIDQKKEKKRKNIIAKTYTIPRCAIGMQKKKKKLRPTFKTVVLYVAKHPCVFTILFGKSTNNFRRKHRLKNRYLNNIMERHF